MSRSRSRLVRAGRFPALLVIVLLALPLLAARPASAAVPDQAAARAALEWLRAQQQPDGSYSAFGGPGDAATTADAILAYAAGGFTADDFGVTDGPAPEDYLLTSADLGALDAGKAAKVVLALHAVNLNPRDVGGVDLVTLIVSAQDPATGWYDRSFYAHLLAVLALQSQGVPLADGALAAIDAAQLADGSWGFTGDTTPGTGDSNTTALAIQALAATGGDSARVAAGLAYLESLQDDAGAVAYDAATLASSGGDANSTAVAIQAFVAAGQDPALAAGGDLLAALLDFRNPSGAFQFQPSFPDDSLLATVQAVPALLLKDFPLDPIPTESPLEDAVRPVVPRDGCDYHAPTGHNLCGLFREYWWQHGGLANFGYALTDEFELYGQRVQYFERARFEWHPTNAGTEFEVLLTLVGTQEAERSHRDLMAREEPLGDDCAYYDVTGHNVCGAFVGFWERFGGLPVFGYPVTSAFEEGGATVQYFERARLEYRPGAWPERLDVLLGRLTAEQVDRELAR